MIFITYVTIIITFTSLAKAQEAQWVDPHEMIIDNIKPVKSRENQSKPETVDDSACVTFALEHYKRLISFILNNAVLNDHSSSYTGHLTFNIPVTDHKLLLHFIREGSEDAAVLRKIDVLMNRILTRSKFEDFKQLLITWSDYIYFTFYNRTTGIIISCIFLLFISYKLLRANITLWSVTKYFIFIGWIVDFAFTWNNLLQEAEINKLADTLKYQDLPLGCDPSKMSFWQYFWNTYLSTKEECREYHHIMYKEVFWSVAPLQVLSHQLGIVIYTPAVHIGKAIGSFSSGILASLPWGVNIVLLPSLLLFTLLVFGILLAITTETSFQINIIHLLSIKFGNREQAPIGDVVTGRNLTTLLEAVGRNMIEDVSSVSSENSSNETCACSATIEQKENVKTIKEGEDKNSNIPVKLNDNNDNDNEKCDDENKKKNEENDN